MTRTAFSVWFCPLVQKVSHVQKDVTAFKKLPLFQNPLSGRLPDTADKLFLSLLSLIEVLVALVVAIHNAGLPRLQDLGNKGAFISLGYR